MKNQFIEFLKEKNLHDTFFSYLKHVDKDEYFIGRAPIYYIQDAFPLSSTPEGLEFWGEVDGEWSDVVLNEM